MEISIPKLVGSRLSGRLCGRKDYAQLCGSLAESPQGSLVFLSLEGLEYINASWINSALVPLLRWVGSDQVDLFPVFCHVREDWMDEFQLVAQWTYQCYLFVPRPETPPKRAEYVGRLDSAQEQTLQAVLKLKRVTGAELERQEREPKATAWNNRLKDLFDKRLIRRERQGRELWYSGVAEDIVLYGR